MSDAPRSEPADVLPAPLTPADCDLQDFAFMPLHVARLRDSDMASEADPEACWYAVLLWAASWHQLPAASLPDNDAVLTRLCGLGRDVATFTRLRADVLRGFIKCADGRLYHPVVAEQALESWTKKQSYQTRKAERIEIARKAADARWSRDASQKDAAALPDASKNDAQTMHDASRADASCMADAMPKGTGTGTGRIIDREAKASLSSRGARSEGGDGSDPALGDAAWREVQALYGSLVVKGRGSPMLAKSAWLNLEPDERRALPAAIRAYAAAKPWGSSGPPGLARFLGEDFWREFAPSASVTSIVWGGPETLRAAVAAEMGDGFARSYLDPAEYRPAATADGLPSLLPLNPTAATKLRAVRALAGVAIQDPILPRRHG